MRERKTDNPITQVIRLRLSPSTAFTRSLPLSLSHARASSLAGVFRLYSLPERAQGKERERARLSGRCKHVCRRIKKCSTRPPFLDIAYAQHTYSHRQTGTHTHMHVDAHCVCVCVAHVQTNKRLLAHSAIMTFPASLLRFCCCCRFSSGSAWPLHNRYALAI